MTSVMFAFGLGVVLGACLGAVAGIVWWIDNEQ